MLLVLFAPFASYGQTVDFSQQYRIKSTSTNKYINAFNNTMHEGGAYGGVGVADFAESNAQIFTIEDAGSNQIYLLTADGYYVKCWAWNVDAYSTTDKTALQLVDAGNETFYIKNMANYKYFKVEYVGDGGEYFIFGDCSGACQETWVLEAVESEEPEQPEIPEEPEVPATEELVVGEGTYGTSVAPFRNTYYNSWVETIYPLSEIGELAFTINSIAYNCASVGVSEYTLSEVNIYIGETTRTQIENSSDWTPESELTLVYSGNNVVISDEEWETFVLDTPYEFSGTKNLVIAVGKKSAQFNASVKWYSLATEENSIMYTNSDTDESFANYPTNNGSMSYYRPNVKLVYSNATEPVQPEPEQPENPTVAEGDTWENAIEITSFPFSSTPDYANLNNDYSLPGLGEDGKDVAYKLTLA